MAYSLSYSKAILVLCFIADKIRRGETEYISTKVISELLDIPRPTLTVIFNNLIKAGILESKEGIYGGVRFSRDPKDITLLDVLDAIESKKPLFQTSFDIAAKAKRPEQLKKRVIQHLSEASDATRAVLAATTLKEILEE